MTAIETLRGFVNAWNCDENHHLNIQFYFRFFEDAAGHFMAINGIRPGDRPTPMTRHVRYHSELFGGQLVRVESHAASGDVPGRWHLVHRLREPATGRLAATALDTFHGDPPVAPTGDVPEEARPRSLPAEPADIASLAERNPPVSHRGRFEGDEIDDRGHPRHRALVARFSDAASHLWERLGAAQPWLAEHNIGRVALEMKVTRGQPCEPGLVDLRSGALATGGKTLSFFHLVRASDSGVIVAAGEVTALLLDRGRRKAIELPDGIRLLARADIGG